MTVHTWRDISAARRARPGAQAATLRYRREIDTQVEALAELRRARDLTQEQLAEEIGKPQPAVSRLEKQADLYVSTLRRYVEAMGGTLEVIASFPDATVRINRFSTLDAEPGEHHGTASP